MPGGTHFPALGGLGSGSQTPYPYDAYSRQYLPKQSDLGEHSQAALNKIALRLNQWPRKTLNFRCPADKLSESVALTT